MNSVKYNSLIDERICRRTLQNGMKCYIIPKMRYTEKQAMLAVNYGSVDCSFTAGGKKYFHPAGVAHFLEHKMFEDEKINVFERFLSLEANVNAFTNFTCTAYYFSCTENFYESLRFLLGLVRRPYLTGENVAKEKPIIAQEIEMYEDNPFWCMYFNLLNTLYEESPIRRKISGSVDDIGRITADMLRQSHGIFYRPGNMVLCCAGNVEAGRVFELAEADMPAGEPIDVTREYGSERAQAAGGYAEKSMALARPMFQLGFKDTDFSTAFAERSAATKILLEMLFGESSLFFERLYSEGTVDGPFALEYTAGTFYGAAVCSNSADDPRKAADLVLGEIERARAEGLDEGRFKRIKRKQLGRFIRGFNSIENITHGQTELAFRGADLFGLLEAYQSVTFGGVCGRFERLLRGDNYAVSAVTPK